MNAEFERSEEMKNMLASPLFIRDLIESQQQEMIACWKRVGDKELVKAYEEGEYDIQIGVAWRYQDAKVRK